MKALHHRIESRNRINISTVIERTWTKELVHIYLASIRSIIEYAAPAWSFPSTGYLIAQLEAIQRRVLRIIFPCFEYADALKMANIPTIEQRLTISMSYFKQMKSNEHKLNHLFPQHYQNQYSTRSQTKGIVAVPQARTKRAANSFIIKASRHFNNELTGNLKKKLFYNSNVYYNFIHIYKLFISSFIFYCICKYYQLHINYFAHCILDSLNS